MTRPRKQTVDYFPHQCNHGETMFILEQRYGNDGYAFWFKLLEHLGKTEGHCLDCKKLTTLNYLAAKTLVTKEKAEEMLNLLAELEAIDTELWLESKIIWSDNFVSGLAFAYRNREVVIPDKPGIERKESGICGTTDVRNPQMKWNEMKGNEMKWNDTDPPPKKSRKSKTPETPLPDNFAISDSVRTWAAEKGHDRLDDHFEAFVDYALSRGKVYADWDSALKRAIRDDWAKLKGNGSGLPQRQLTPLSKADQITAGNLAARERILKKYENQGE